MNRKSNSPSPDDAKSRQPRSGAHDEPEFFRAGWEGEGDEFNFAEPFTETEDSYQEVVGTWALQPVSARPDFGIYLTQLWQRRFFIWTDARSRAFTRGRGMLLGNAWLILQPVLDALIYFIIFGLVLQVAREGVVNFVGYLIIGIFMFQYTMRCLNVAGTSIQSGKSMIRAFSFPRASLPISGVIREALGMLPVLATMAVLITFMPEITTERGMISGPAELSWRWFLFPAVFGLQTIFNLGIALIASRLTAVVPDLKLIIPFFGRFWFYGSGVMFTVERFISDPDLLAVVKLNPMFLVLDITRDLLLYGTTPELRSWLILGLWAIVTAIAGMLFFWRAEVRYADDR